MIACQYFDGLSRDGRTVGGSTCMLKMAMTKETNFIRGETLVWTTHMKGYKTSNPTCRLLNKELYGKVIIPDVNWT